LICYAWFEFFFWSSLYLAQASQIILFYKEYPSFDHTDITDIIDLDNATSQAILGKYASIPVSLINESDKNANNFHFNNKHFLDKNEEEWFEDQIENFVNNFLEKKISFT
jgi:hypothetical protein